jgi:hypothetical protein
MRTFKLIGLNACDSQWAELIATAAVAANIKNMVSRNGQRIFEKMITSIPITTSHQPMRTRTVDAAELGIAASVSIVSSVACRKTSFGTTP